MNSSLNLIGVLRIILKWKWMVIGFVLIAGISAAVYTWFFMDNYYQSVVKFYPKNLIYTDKMVNIGQESSTTHVSFFGSKDDANRILEIAYSAEVVQGLINRYDLATVYEIDTTKKYWRTKVTEQFMDNYQANRTEKDAIELSIMDTDPLRAQQMVSDAISWIDRLNRMPMDSTRMKIRVELQSAYDAQLMLSKSLLDTLASQAARFDIQISMTGDGKASVSGSNPLEVETYKFNQFQYESAIEELGLVKVLLDKHDLALKVAPSSIHIVEEPFVADKKAKPMRSLICITVVLVAFIISILVAILIEQIKWIRSELDNDEQAA